MILFLFPFSNISPKYAIIELFYVKDALLLLFIKKSSKNKILFLWKDISWHIWNCLLEKTKGFPRPSCFIAFASKKCEFSRERINSRRKRVLAFSGRISRITVAVRDSFYFPSRSRSRSGHQLASRTKISFG